jgi:hypothetical protein
VYDDEDAPPDDQAKTPHHGVAAEDSSSSEPPSPLDSVLSDIVVALQNVRGALVKAVETFNMECTPPAAVTVPDGSAPAAQHRSSEGEAS